MDWALVSSFKNSAPLTFFALAVATLSACSSTKGGVFSSGDERAKPIKNPFSDYFIGAKGETSQPLILRTKKGDRSVELEIPGDTNRLSDFVLPMSPAFKDGDKGQHVTGTDDTLAIDERYQSRALISNR